MNPRIAVALAGTAFVGCLTALSFVTFAQRPGQTETAVEAESQSQPAAASETLEARYAKACLDLAKVELELRREANRRTANTYTAADIEQQESNVRLAEEQLRLAQQPSGPDADLSSIYLLRAEDAAKQARQAYTEALESRRLDPAYSDLQLKRLQLQAERAQLRWAMWQDPTDNPLDHVHWELNRLSEELLALDRKLDRIIDQINN